ncbi:Cache domain-containing protein [Hydrogenivirga caldilitoris]|uniref:Cache domain-containing protein n=1 Tax=Hydrogenivirga caldilitoris TaxID=246264 RepID=A0A497XLS9_9AQUI|nr:cache domain-containing protein [Hydrogenivirga caldilitoris]RLJ69775.1 Cache domain-containing protein [Hydrogenivirga caldilitoris]
MKAEEISLLDISISIPTVPYDIGLKELKGIFEELKIYKYLTVLKENTPIGLVYRDAVDRYSNERLTAGDIAIICTKLRNTSLRKENLTDLFDMLPIDREPVIVVDKRGTYLGVLTYDTLLHYITHHKEYILPIMQRVHSSIGRKEYLCIFGLKNLDKFKEVFDTQKLESVKKMFLEDIKELFEGEITGILEKGEFWILSSNLPQKESIKELFKEFHKEYTLLFGEFQHVHIYGFCLDMSVVDSEEKLYNLQEELRNRTAKIEGSVFIIYGLQPTLILHDPTKQKLITNIKKRILEDFKEVVERVRITPKDTWEHVLYDMFEKYPYFELFYIMSDKGLQITNNIVNPKVDYFVAQGKKGTDRSEKPYFKEAIAGGTFISDVYLSKATDDFCITVSESFTYEGKTYVLAGDINFRQIHKLVKSLKETTV